MEIKAWGRGMAYQQLWSVISEPFYHLRHGHAAVLQGPSCMWTACNISQKAVPTSKNARSGLWSSGWQIRISCTGFDPADPVFLYVMVCRSSTMCFAALIWPHETHQTP